MTKYTLNKATWHEEAPWCASWRDGKRRHRKFFDTKQAAEIWIKDQNTEVKVFGSAAIPDDLRIEALRSQDLLEGTGASVLEAVRYYVARKNISNKSVSFHELLRQVIDHTEPQVAKGERSAEHLAGIRKVGKRLDVDFGARIVSEIDKVEIVKWLESLEHLSLSSKDFYRRYANSIFAFAIHRGYAASNPCHGIPKMAHKGEIGILAPHEVLALLRNCHPSMVPFYALGCFAGLRPMSELMRLTWDKVHWEDRVIDVENVKTRNHANSPRNRYVQISDNLYAWLKHASASIPVGRVVPGNWRDFVYGTRGDRIVRGVSDRDKAGHWLQMQGVQYPGLIDWPHDCMRHSFASYHYAKYGDAAKLAEQLGHTSAQLVFSNYRRKVKPAEAEKFWSIVP